MSDKKHIDRLFQEGFKDFEATPPPQVWEDIQAALKKEEKEDRKIIPIWWRVGGIAALLALLFTVGSIWWSQDDSNDGITQEEVVPLNSEDETTEDLTPKVINNTVDNKTESIADDTNLKQTENTDDSKSSNESKLLNTDPLKTVADSDNPKVASDKDPVIKRDAISNTLNSKTNPGVAANEDKTSADKTQAVSKADAVQTEKGNKAVMVDDKSAKELIDAQTQTGVATDTNTDKTQATTQTDTQNPSEEGKISIYDAIQENEDLKEATVIEIEDELDNRWSVAPQVAPVFYGDFSEGSTVGAEFADNPTSTDANLSYGVQVQYQISQKFAVRSGVNRVNLSVNTNEIEFGVVPGTSAVGNKFEAGNVTYAIGDRGTLNSEAAQLSPGTDLESLSIDTFEGLLNQQFEYWEVPLELSYALIDNRFKMNLFGGFSTLFLQDNSLTAVSGQRETSLGSVDNLNELSFTTNIGLGLQYDISKRFAVNVEPVFKYQLNPYTDSSIGSQPYYMGVYSGLRFRF